MAIRSLRVTDFRNLAAVDLMPSAGLNVIYGNNGSGKTSLLEAIYYLGLGRSFRSTSSAQLARHSTKQFSVFSHIINNEFSIPVGVERETSGQMRLRIAEKDISSITEVAYLLPIRMINSHSHYLFESGPLFRRKYLDWGLFYQSNQFLECWRQFERTLRQRNILLRDKHSRAEIEIWTLELVKYGRILDQLRREYVQILTPKVVEIAQILLSINDLTIEIEYESGWGEDLDYANVLTQAYYEELRLGHTQFGPHRADLDVKINTVSVKHFLSRGQQKLLICAMILAQGLVLAQYANRKLVYLIDDLPAELDLSSKQKLIALLIKQQTQIFVTAIESKEISFLTNELPQAPTKLFHVEHGQVVETLNS